MIYISRVLELEFMLDVKINAWQICSYYESRTRRSRRRWNKSIELLSFFFLPFLYPFSLFKLFILNTHTHMQTYTYIPTYGSIAITYYNCSCQASIIITNGLTANNIRRHRQLSKKLEKPFWEKKDWNGSLQIYIYIVYNLYWVIYLY